MKTIAKYLRIFVPVCILMMTTELYAVTFGTYTSNQIPTLPFQSTSTAMLGASTSGFGAISPCATTPVGTSHPRRLTGGGLGGDDDDDDEERGGGTGPMAGTGGSTTQQEYIPIGDAVLPLLLLALVFAVYRRRHDIASALAE